MQYKISQSAASELFARNRRGAHLDIATRDFSLSPPAERGERVGERGIGGFADLGGSGFPTGRPPLPHPLLQRGGGGGGRGLGGGLRWARRDCGARLAVALAPRSVVGWLEVRCSA